jgi:hypothetical protein
MPCRRCKYSRRFVAGLSVLTRRPSGNLCSSPPLECKKRPESLSRGGLASGPQACTLRQSRWRNVLTSVRGLSSLCQLLVAYHTSQPLPPVESDSKGQSTDGWRDLLDARLCWGEKPWGSLEVTIKISLTRLAADFHSTSGLCWSILRVHRHGAGCSEYNAVQAESRHVGISPS